MPQAHTASSAAGVRRFTGGSLRTSTSAPATKKTKTAANRICMPVSYSER